MTQSRLPMPLRRLLIAYLQATRHLRAAARQDDLSWFQDSLDERQRVLEDLRQVEVAVADRPRVRRLARTAEICAERAQEILQAATDTLSGELTDLRDHRKRGVAFRSSVMTRPSAGTWLDLNS